MSVESAVAADAPIGAAASSTLSDSLSDWLVHPDPSPHHHTYAVSRGADMSYTGDVRRLSSESDYAEIPLSSTLPDNDLARSLEDLLGTEGHIDDEHEEFSFCTFYDEAEPVIPPNDRASLLGAADAPHILTANVESPESLSQYPLTDMAMRPVSNGLTSVSAGDNVAEHSTNVKSILTYNSLNCDAVEPEPKLAEEFAVRLTPVQICDDVTTDTEKFANLKSIRSSAIKAAMTPATWKLNTSTSTTEQRELNGSQTATGPDTGTYGGTGPDKIDTEVGCQPVRGEMSYSHRHDEITTGSKCKFLSPN